MLSFGSVGTKENKMTWTKEQLGDKGQRYMLEAEGYPKSGWQPIAYGNTLQGMQLTAEGILLAPGCTAVRIIDRYSGDTLIPINVKHSVNDG